MRDPAGINHAPTPNPPSTSTPTLMVSVAYALPEQQHQITVHLAPGATVSDAIHASGLLSQHPQIDLQHQAVGVFGQVVTSDTPVYDGARVEIYRPLQQDPRTLRKHKAQRSA